jgi:hypothetical protein
MNRSRPFNTVQELQLELADLQLVAIRYLMALDAFPVDIGAVQTIEVLSEKAVGVDDNARVVPRDGNIVKKEVVLWATPYGEGVTQQRYDLSLPVVARADYEESPRCEVRVIASERIGVFAIGNSKGKGGICGLRRQQAGATAPAETRVCRIVHGTTGAFDHGHSSPYPDSLTNPVDLVADLPLQPHRPLLLRRLPISPMPA